MRTFGSLPGIMILLHGGTDSGGALTTALMITYDVVIVTGILGIFLLLVVPRTADEDRRHAAADRRFEDSREGAAEGDCASRGLAFSDVGAIWFADGRAALLSLRLSASPISEARAAGCNDRIRARREFERGCEPFDEKERRKLFEAVEAAATLRRVDALIYLHRLLKLWLPPHVASTSLMLALMLVHIVQVIYYAF